jgi:hypothetical protein
MGQHPLEGEVRLPGVGGPQEGGHGAVHGPVPAWFAAAAGARPGHDRRDLTTRAVRRSPWAADRGGGQRPPDGDPYTLRDTENLYFGSNGRLGLSTATSGSTFQQASSLYGPGFGPPVGRPFTAVFGARFEF